MRPERYLELCPALMPYSIVTIRSSSPAEFWWTSSPAESKISPRHVSEPLEWGVTAFRIRVHAMQWRLACCIEWCFAPSSTGEGTVEDSDYISFHWNGKEPSLCCHSNRQEPAALRWWWHCDRAPADMGSLRDVAASSPSEEHTLGSAYIWALYL